MDSFLAMGLSALIVFAPYAAHADQVPVNFSCKNAYGTSQEQVLQGYFKEENESGAVLHIHYRFPIQENGPELSGEQDIQTQYDASFTKGYTFFDTRFQEIEKNYTLDPRLDLFASEMRSGAASYFLRQLSVALPDQGFGVSPKSLMTLMVYDDSGNYSEVLTEWTCSKAN